MEFEVRADRRPRGAVKLVRERAEFLRLVRQGYPVTVAAERVGVNRRTGYVWRNGQKASGRHPASAPIRPPAQAGASRYLTVEERIHIADRLREQPVSIRRIARELGRAPSTISREIRRNRASADLPYRPHGAQRRAEARAPRPKPCKIACNPVLRAFIAEHLARRWSPEQICRALRRTFPNAPEMHVAHETIYQALYVQGRGQLRRELACALRTGRAARKPQRRPDARRPRFAAGMVMISERPAEVADRAVPGHWEGDLILGADGRSQIGTLVERATRYVLLVHLPADRTAATVADALADTARTLPAHLMKSLTWDQGSEMAGHADFTVATDIPVYFCDPASPWQRGSNENTNGLLRQYFPKGTDLSVHSRDHLAAVAAELNGRPRETLEGDTPAERLARLLTA